MNLPAFIARRYFFSRKKRSFISYLSLLSMLGVGVGTMALVVVLSVFNGMEELNRQLFKSVDADLTLTPVQGKRQAMVPQQLGRLRGLAGIQVITTVATDNALARYADGQTVVRVKGVDSTFLQQHRLDTAMVEGRQVLQQNGINYALVADGIRNSLSMSPEDPLIPLELLFPERNRRLSSLTPGAFRQQQVAVSGVFFVSAPNYSDLVIVPFELARELLGYGPDDYASLEVKLKPGADEAAVQKALQQMAGASWLVQTRDEINRGLFRAIRVEKLFVTLTLAFIILVASINIFYSLSMLVLEKKADIGVMFAMGATPSFIRRIFLAEGMIIAFTGAGVGLLLGLLVCYLQQRYGLIELGTTAGLVNAYPVSVRPNDVIITGGIVIVVTVLTSWFPAQRAARKSFD
ncbi:ABC transporter permease [Fibrella aquatilis]|uniref:ABC transporter permease n=1 Tax=Fibrella aquatilis TaxID=2817059 RepID=A0A939GAS8_9BACT|nr:FtsX-like permease family protein [Fibrella aquatilis]MBO0934130.1 ABC transporter permease [Fibrella aquatilis]